MDSDEGSDVERKKVKEDPMPAHRVRFTDMADNFVEKAIRSKYTTKMLTVLNLTRFLPDSRSQRNTGV